MLDFSFSMPTRILFGAGAHGFLEAELAALDNPTVLLVQGCGSARKNGSYEAVVALLQRRAIRWTEHAGCKADPDDDFVRAGVQMATRDGVNMVLAIGGGSVIDAAKAIALLAANGTADIWAYRAQRARYLASALPLGVVLTTTGTGTEVNGGFVISRRSTQEKVVFTQLSTRPRFAYCNPEFTRGLPARVLADNYTDILAHLLEQYFSMDESLGLVDALVLEAVHYLLRNTPELKNWQNSYAFRANTMFASTISLSYLFSCGKKVPWILHTVTHALAACRPLSHGASLRHVLPGWLTWLARNPAYALRTRHLADKLGLATADQLAAYFANHFATMGCVDEAAASALEKQQIVAAVCDDADFLMRAQVSETDLRAILEAR